MEFVCEICQYSNLYTYKASECKHAIIGLHCATSKSSLWYMGYVPHGSDFERPRIYCTSVCNFNDDFQYIIMQAMPTSKEVTV